ncbi:MAG: response regulator transcription factor [Bacteroidales bacterium]|nr:response regulator transcription factor [Bacteroidales bacterium]MBK7628705.1 response regulator transcription factor [Bacteroidales bacterium]
MKRQTALIIDDERLARLNLRKKLNMFPELEVVGEASGVESGAKAIRELNPDLLFLDIELSDGTGFDLLNKVEFKGKVIFQTAYNEYACRAFEINALDYLLKPITKERLKKAIDNLSNSSDEDSEYINQKFRYDDRIMIEQRKSIYFIKVENIICIKAVREYTSIFEKGGKEYVVLKSIGNWEKELPDEHFARIHRNCIINFNYIERSERYGNTANINLAGMKDSILISRGYYKVIKTRYFYK